jgi:hypothetical protein
MRSDMAHLFNKLVGLLALVDVAIGRSAVLTEGEGQLDIVDPEGARLEPVGANLLSQALCVTVTSCLLF